MLPAILSLLLLLYSSTLPLSIMAQSATDLYSQGIQAGTQYRNAYNSYVQSKNQFLQYRTGSTRLTAISNTNSVLLARNSWQIAYLKYLRQTLADTTNIANYNQTVTYLDLETEINALEGQKNILSASDSFEKVNSASKNWELRLSNSDKLITSAKSQITQARLGYLRHRLQTSVDEFNANHASPSANLVSTINLISSKIQASEVATDPEQSKKLLSDGAKLLLEIYVQP